MPIYVLLVDADGTMRSQPTEPERWTRDSQEAVDWLKPENQIPGHATAVMVLLDDGNGELLYSVPSFTAFISEIQETD